MSKWDNVWYRGVGGVEDDSCVLEHKTTGKRCYVVDTGGRWELCRDITIYSATGNSIATYDDRQDAMKRALEEVGA